MVNKQKRVNGGEKTHFLCDWYVGYESLCYSYHLEITNYLNDCLEKNVAPEDFKEYAVRWGDGAHPSGKLSSFYETAVRTGANAFVCIEMVSPEIWAVKGLPSPRELELVAYAFSDNPEKHRKDIHGQWLFNWPEGFGQSTPRIVLFDMADRWIEIQLRDGRRFVAYSILYEGKEKGTLVENSIV